MAARRGTERRAVDRPPWNKVYEDLPDTGDRPNTEEREEPIRGREGGEEREEERISLTYSRTGGGEGDRDPFLLCSHTNQKGEEK